MTLTDTLVSMWILMWPVFAFFGALLALGLGYYLVREFCFHFVSRPVEKLTSFDAANSLPSLEVITEEVVNVAAPHEMTEEERARFNETMDVMFDRKEAAAPARRRGRPAGSKNRKPRAKAARREKVFA